MLCPVGGMPQPPRRFAASRDGARARERQALIRAGVHHLHVPQDRAPRPRTRRSGVELQPPPGFGGDLRGEPVKPRQGVFLRAWHMHSPHPRHVFPQLRVNGVTLPIHQSDHMLWRAPAGGERERLPDRIDVGP